MRPLCSTRCFFFQAEDGIRDWSVTGVQTCALPICLPPSQSCGGGVLALPVGRARALLQLWDGGKPARPLAGPGGHRAPGRARVRRRVSGGILVFAHGISPLNPPFEWIVGEYNDAHGAAQLIAERADDLAAVIVEPVQGAAGVIPGDLAFLQRLREATASHGVLLVF